jgi:hypothetical protein
MGLNPKGPPMPPTPTHTSRAGDALPTREATATVYRIEAELIDTTMIGHRPSWMPGYVTISARVDVDGFDYRWSVTDARKYAIGDTVTVTVPA